MKLNNNSIINNTKQDRAITLIALVITIVVLIILATVAVNLSLGNNGLFNKAKTAKEQYQNAQDYEETEIMKISNQIDNYQVGTISRGSNNRRVCLLDTPVNIPTTTTTTNRNVDIKLKESIENYTHLEFQIDYHSQNSGYEMEDCKIISTEQLSYNNTNTVNYANGSNISFNINGGVDYASFSAITGYFKDPTIFHVYRSHTDRSDFDYFRIIKIYGINY